jgi:hypothetical protein
VTLRRGCAIPRRELRRRRLTVVDDRAATGAGGTRSHSERVVDSFLELTAVPLADVALNDLLMLLSESRSEELDAESGVLIGLSPGELEVGNCPGVSSRDIGGCGATSREPQAQRRQKS